MKTIVLTLLLLAGAAAGVAVMGTGCNRHPSAEAKAAKFHCPMHPSVVSDKPGECPICGMDLVPIEKSGPAVAPAPKTKTMYRSTMNPSEVSDKPGKDSMGMDMAPFEVTVGEEKTPPGLAAVSIAPAARERMGLALGTVEKRQLVRELRTSAKIVPDETKLYHVTIKIDGYVEKLFKATTGEYVKEGEPLLTIYSPDLYSAQQEYLNVVKGSPDLAEAARKRLRLWDITDAQIDELAKAGKPERTLTFNAPASGWLIERDIAAGHKVTSGEQLLVLGDLTNVWADSDVYQSDIPYVKMGMPVELSVSAVPDRTFGGRVTFIAPVLDAQTRTVRVRTEVANQDLLLKPEMFAVARLKFDLGEKLAIPHSAVMRTGDRDYAFRDAGDGRLVPTLIKVGARSGDWFELVSGLNAGDKVVTSANFLVDSESAMRAALEAITGK